MSFRHRWFSSGSPAALFEAHRDGLVAFGAHLRGVRAVERLETRPDGDRLHLRHRWTGDPATLPWALRPAGRLFVWEDQATWDAAALVGRWTITAPALGAMVRIDGEHQFRVDGPGCRIDVEGELSVAMVGALGGPTADRFIERLFADVLDSASPVIEAFRAAPGR